jgi:predicted amidohydrolase YtcJ
VGKLADFVIVDMEWDADTLLEAKTMETWYGGKQVWSSEDVDSKVANV